MLGGNEFYNHHIGHGSQYLQRQDTYVLESCKKPWGGANDGVHVSITAQAYFRKIQLRNWPSSLPLQQIAKSLTVKLTPCGPHSTSVTSQWFPILKVCYYLAEFVPNSLPLVCEMINQIVHIVTRVDIILTMTWRICVFRGRLIQFLDMGRPQNSYRKRAYPCLPPAGRPARNVFQHVASSPTLHIF